MPRGADGVPVFDVFLVGVGPDGHLLSVFPDSAVWDRPELVVGVPAPTHVEPHLPRVTMHPRVIAAARHVLLVTSGASKAEKVGRAWTGDDLRELPDPRRPGPERDLVPRRGGRRGAAAGLSPRQRPARVAGPATPSGARPSGGRSRPATPGTARRSRPLAAVAPMATPIASGDTTTGHACVVA